MNRHDTDRAPVRVVIAGQAEFATCLEIRTRVFVEEQGVPPELEEDRHDPDCHPLAGALDRRSGRNRPSRGALATPSKAERVAVEPRYPTPRRGTGPDGGDRGLGSPAGPHLHLHAQRPAHRPSLLSCRLGYQAEGAIFEEAGIPHRRTEQISEGEPRRRAAARFGVRSITLSALVNFVSTATPARPAKTRPTVRGSDIDRGSLWAPAIHENS